MKIILRLMIRGITDLRYNPRAIVLSFVAVTLIAFLGGLFLLFINNVNRELNAVQGNVVFQVYWQQDAPLESVQAQWAQMGTLPFLQSKTTYTPKQALQELTQSLGNDADLSRLQETDPLPATAVLSFLPDTDDDAQWLLDMKQRLMDFPMVHRVHSSHIRSETAQSWSKLGRTVFWPLVAFLALIPALVVGNTIKLAQLTRREEIDIMHLVGAKRWYIRLPFLIGGAFLGLLGGVFALVTLKFVQSSFQGFLSGPPFWLQLHFLPFDQALIFLLVLVIISILGSWAAIND